jgi:hypothetical protein
MIDFDKAEFLAKLDVRFAAFSSLLEIHEKYIISLCKSKEAFIDATKAVNKHHKELYKFIEDTDKKINDFFEKAKSEADKQQTSNADVVEVRHGHWYIREYEFFTCSECGHDYWNGCDYTEQAKERLKNGEHPNFCPNCGAKMDGERREE